MKKIYLSPSDQNRNMYAYGDTNEMEQCQRMADACEAALKRHGFEVINNKTDTMTQRVAESNAWGADLHVPIHTNAYNRNVTGTRMFYYSEQSPGKAPCQAIFARLAPLTPGTSESLKAYPELYEMRVPNAASVYIEVDFHDVAKIAKWLIENPEAIGEAICAGICDYYGVEYKAPSSGGDEMEKILENYRAARDVEDPLYAELADVPEYWQTDVQRLIDSGALRGDGVHAVAKRRSELSAIIVAARHIDNYFGNPE